MFDTLAASQELTQAGLNAEQAAAITHTVQRAIEHGDHVTSDQFQAGLAEVRTEIANLDTRLSTQIGRIESELKSDMKLLKFGYGPVILGLLIKLVFFP